MKPYYYLLERGDDPVSAYRKTHEQMMRNIEFRTWYRNKALGSDYEDEVVLQVRQGASERGQQAWAGGMRAASARGQLWGWGAEERECDSQPCKGIKALGRAGASV